MWSRLAADLLSPPACAACDVATARGVAFCAACAATVERTDDLAEPPEGSRPWGGDVLAPFVFGGALAVAVRRLKYEERPDLAAPLGGLLAAVCGRARLRAELVVPVPLHPRRLAERGYNQAALLASHVARAVGARHLARGLVRRLDTPRQAELDRAGRLENVRDAFSVRDARAVLGRRVLVVDDVATTGATLRAAIRPLRVAGASSIVAVVVARTSID